MSDDYQRAWFALGIPHPSTTEVFDNDCESEDEIRTTTLCGWLPSPINSELFDKLIELIALEPSGFARGAMHTYVMRRAETSDVLKMLVIEDVRKYVEEEIQLRQLDKSDSKSCPRKARPAWTGAQIDGYSQRMSAYWEPSPELVDPYDVELDKLARRREVVEALITGINNFHRVIDLTLDSSGYDEARAKICEVLGISEAGAAYVMDMTASRLTKVGRQEYVDELEKLRESVDQLHAQGRDAFLVEWRATSTVQTHHWIISDVKRKLKRRVTKYVEHPTTHDPQRMKVDEVRVEGGKLIIDIHDDNLPDHLYALRMPMNIELDFSYEMYERFEDFIKNTLAEIERLITVDGLPILEPPPPVIGIDFP